MNELTLSEGRQELGRLSDAEEPHKRKHGDVFLNRWPVQHGEKRMRQRRQKGLLQRTEKYDIVKDTVRGDWKMEGLNLLDK